MSRGTYLPAANLVFLALHVTVVVHLMVTGRFAWLEHLPRALAVGTVPLTVLAAVLLLVFYVGFYHFLIPCGPGTPNDSIHARNPP